MQQVMLREELRQSDIQSIQKLTESTGFFYPDEIKIACDLAEETIQKTDEYHFLFAELAGEVVGYTCYGEIPCSEGSYDLYWIVVHKKSQGQGVGRLLLEKTEAKIAVMGGRGIYIETSSRELYQPTQLFYKKCGYELEAVLKDFYRPYDDKLIYSKKLPPEKIIQ